MHHELFGWLHAQLAWALREERGQGTVEYVGIMLLLAAVLAVAVKVAGPKGNGIGETIVAEIKQAIQKAGAK